MKNKNRRKIRYMQEAIRQQDPAAFLIDNPIAIEMLRFLGTFKVATREQLCRAVEGGGDALALALSDDLAGDGKAEFVWAEIPAYGEGKPRAGCPTERICYVRLTANGRLAYLFNYGDAQRQSPAFIDNYDRVNLHHDLYVVEAFLYCKEKLGALRCDTEDMLREFGGAGAIPDFRFYSSDGSYQDCEVVVQNNREDLEKKPDYIWYFTPSRRQADAIQNLKTAFVFMLPSLIPGAPVPKKAPCKRTKQPQDMTSQEHKILAFLSQTSLSLSAGAIGKLLDMHRSDASRALSSLTNQGRIFATEVVSNPGISRGRPVKLFSIEPFLDDDVRERMKAVLFSKQIAAR